MGLLLPYNINLATTTFTKLLCAHSFHVCCSSVYTFTYPIHVFVILWIPVSTPDYTVLVIHILHALKKLHYPSRQLQEVLFNYIHEHGEKQNWQSLTFMGPCIANIFQYISNKMQLTQFIYIWKLLYMFRAVLPPVIRSAYNCIYSIWHLSHRYCYLPLSWKSWNWFEYAVGGDATHSILNTVPTLPR